jgi:hypothetical protein
MGFTIVGFRIGESAKIIIVFFFIDSFCRGHKI